MRFIILIAAMALTGCASGSLPALDAAPPANYRQIVAEYVRSAFFDPYSIRDASITRPKPGQLSRADAIAVEVGWIVCLKANAKNRMGGYTGLRTTALLVRDGAVVTSHSGEEHYEVRSNCATQPYEPFMEIGERTSGRSRQRG